MARLKFVHGSAAGASALMACATSIALVLSPAWAGAAAASQAEPHTRFDTVAQMMRAPDVTGTVSTAGDEAPGDGAGMTYEVTDELPGGDEGNIAVPLANGRWAVPQGLPTGPSRPHDATAVEDVIARAQTFVDAGTSLVWDAGRATPLTGAHVRATTSPPYPITCSSFVGMVMVGWDYPHTTYAADENTRVGRWVDLGKPPQEHNTLWDANGLASWFYAHGDLWLDQDGDYLPGDILFFSEQGVGGQSTVGDRTFFGNVYHTAIYLGNGEVMHSTGPASATGVHRDKLSESLKADLSFVARPRWEGGWQPGPGPSAGAGSAEPTMASAAPSDAPQPRGLAPAQPAVTGPAATGSGAPREEVSRDGASAAAIEAPSTRATLTAAGTSSGGAGQSRLARTGTATAALCAVAGLLVIPGLLLLMRRRGGPA